MTPSLLNSALPTTGEVILPRELQDWLGRRQRNFVGGQFVDSGEAPFVTLNPATQAVLSQVEPASRDLVQRAVAKGREAFEHSPWRRLTIKERAAVVRRIGDRILEHRATLAVLESLDTGKPIRESFDGDIPRAASNFHFFAAAAEQTEESAFRSDGYLHLGMREPLGVCLLITPWNLPLYLETWKLAPALVMGNSVLLKPSELTPLTAIYLCEIIQDLLPEGVFQCLQGFGEGAAGEWLVADPGTDAISFTGETATGRAIMAVAAKGPKKVSFELGGKGASILFADANLAEAVDTCVRAAFRNQGEICLATPRIFVEESVYDAFVGEYLSKVKALRVGNPLDYRTSLGALISAEHTAKVERYLESTTAAQRATGGNRVRLEGPFAQGNFLEPTVLVDLPLDHPISREEVFGPVVSVYRFRSESEVVDWVNQTPYGLSASIWTRDLARALRVGQSLRKGLVWVNQWFVRDLRVPFGGQKKSGLGREGGRFSLDFFSEWKSLCLPM